MTAYTIQGFLPIANIAEKMGVTTVTVKSAVEMFRVRPEYFYEQLRALDKKKEQEDKLKAVLKKELDDPYKAPTIVNLQNIAAQKGIEVKHHVVYKTVKN